MFAVFIVIISVVISYTSAATLSLAGSNNASVASGGTGAMFNLFGGLVSR